MYIAYTRVLLFFRAHSIFKRIDGSYILNEPMGILKVHTMRKFTILTRCMYGTHIFDKVLKSSSNRFILVEIAYRRQTHFKPVEK